MAKNKKSSSKPAAPIVNRRARFDYELGDEIVAGGMRFIIKRKIRHRLEQIKIERVPEVVESSEQH